MNGEARFHGHRLLLAIASPVFRALLEGAMAESQQTVVEINKDETHARWFGVMLDHLYPYDRRNCARPAGPSCASPTSTT